MERVNDLSFILGGKLVVFFEHQSTINQNMPLRDLFYCSRVYEKIIDIEALYGSRQVKIPTPEFYVLYNGLKQFPEKAVYKLSEMYEVSPEGEPSLELVVNVLNVNDGFNNEIVKRSEALSGYVTLVSKIREYESAGMTINDAVKAAVRYCMDNGILADYLKKHSSEVSRMLLEEWNLDTAKAVWQNEAKSEGIKIGLSQGKAEGVKIGKKQGKKEERKKWESVVAAKDADLATKDAEIEKLKSQLSLKQ
jgi:hypothetical protein